MRTAGKTPTTEQHLPAARIERIVLGGHVQGVGFRPFVYRHARRYGIRGWVRNELGEVHILAQAPPQILEQFVRTLIREAPPLARPELLARTPAEEPNVQAFAILPSNAAGPARIYVPPDYFTCPDCLKELHDPKDRRHRYPFINCTQCGPRYTLIRRLPYDRANTTMAGFVMCRACRREYEDPGDRRFHAEPIACRVCGPRLQFETSQHPIIHDTAAALAACVEALRRGAIVAVKGVGGYHLLCNASDGTAIERLRRHKPRPHKPLAVMFPVTGRDGLAAVRKATAPEAVEAKCLLEPMRPIVLLKTRPGASLSARVAPGLNEIGAFLPYSPLHHLLVNDLGAPVVATSANISGEPVITDNREARERLAHVADAFLHHDRPIERPADDAVFRVIAGQARPLRLGRGGAPLELALPRRLDRPLLAVGGHMKNTIALAWDDRIVISPHIGDLDAPRSLAVFAQLIDDLQTLYNVKPERVLCDAHPGYASTRWAKCSGLPVTPVYHHYAHASAIAGEFPHEGRWLVFTWDGVGYGTDGGLWGGEALLGRPGLWRRAASFRPFYLPGGDKAAREPWRSAAALCWEIGRPWRGGPPEIDLLFQAWQRRLNCPATTAVGRLFDAAAALTDLVHEASYEGQGPMHLEAAVDGTAEAIALALHKNAGGVWESDWAPLVPMLCEQTVEIGRRAACFHASLAQALLDQAEFIRKEHGELAVGLSGGVFQNKVLTEHAITLLRDAGFRVYLPEAIPCNDAGLSYGQIMEAGLGLT